MIWLKVTTRKTEKHYIYIYHISNYNIKKQFTYLYIIYRGGADLKLCTHRQPPTMTKLNHTDVSKRAAFDLTDVTL